MTRNQLPEGVGKKIVEALKRQAEADITPLEENNSVLNNTVPLSEIEDVEGIQFNSLVNEADNVIVEEENQTLTQGISQTVNINTDENQPAVEETKVENISYNAPEFKPVSEEKTNTVQEFTFAQTNSMNNEKFEKEITSNVQINIPSNVKVLKNLISTLPVGVTKQTGAQIIRQTLEAMGIPMNSVLKEAQEVQEELNSSTRECMMKIQEYKSQILQLEQSVQQYQQNVTQINDLVSLFLLTDKK